MRLQVVEINSSLTSQFVFAVVVHEFLVYVQTDFLIYLGAADLEVHVVMGWEHAHGHLG